jgi:hypothetical protein
MTPLKCPPRYSFLGNGPLTCIASCGVQGDGEHVGLALRLSSLSPGAGTRSARGTSLRPCACGKVVGVVRFPRLSIKPTICKETVSVWHWLAKCAGPRRCLRCLDRKATEATNRCQCRPRERASLAAVSFPARRLAPHGSGFVSRTQTYLETC